VNYRIIRCCTALACGFAAMLVAGPPAVADQIRDRQWHLNYLDVTKANGMSEGDGVVVAVVDTGVNENHPDLIGNVLPGLDSAGAAASNDDLVGHGTAMAGLIAGHGHGPEHADGVLGIAPRAKILPVRVTEGEHAAPDNIASGIEAAVKAGARVISVSLTGSDVPRLRNATRAAIAADAVVVAAIGNKPEDILPGFPATYDGVIAVGATDQEGNVASMSVTGPQMVLSAPGARIVSTDKQGYEIGDGTSASTAIVAGAVALIRSKYPNLKAPEVIHRLTATATDKGAPGRDPEYGYGVLNIVAALTANVPPLTPSATPPTTPPTGAGNAAPPTNKRTGSSTGVIVAVILLVVAVAAGILIWAAVRRRGRAPAT
jgi:type VII secretion-associated serine protease mycosin